MRRKRRLTTQELAQELATAHSDLNIFAAVQRLMESSLISTENFADEARIVSLAKAAQEKCLARYDAARLNLSCKPK